ncbi:MAG: nitroreductase [Opitutaceae bacterium]|nr:nitroreductase [Opitutaceae bacterium]
MDVLTAIYQRRSIRHFTDAPVPASLVHELIRAATQAPSAVNQQPWVFGVIRGRRRLDGYSERAKAHLLAILPQALSLHRRADTLASHEYNVFHHAGTLVFIAARPAPHHPEEDCCLAAQNLMLAAHALGLGTCPIGFARPWLNLPAVKAELGIPGSCHVVMPLAVGWPAGQSAPVPREPPEIVCWQEDARPAG